MEDHKSHGIYLSDTSIRIYQRKDGRESLRLRSYLMVPTDTGFSLSAYLKTISCSLRLASGQTMEFDEVGLANDGWYEIGVMVHSLHAWSIVDTGQILGHVAWLRVHYHLSFTGHPSEKAESFECRVPLIRQFWNPRRLPWAMRSTA